MKRSNIALVLPLLVAATVGGCVGLEDESTSQDRSGAALVRQSYGDAVGTHASMANVPTDVNFVPGVALPPFTTTLKGEHEVLFRNANDFPVLVAVRSGKRGIDLRIPANSIASAQLPDGDYVFSVVFSIKPNALFQGDRFALPSPRQVVINVPRTWL